MNTVDALKDLYKALAGKDYAGDPNPTDAEMIKAIAKDGTGGGSGGGDGSGLRELVIDENGVVHGTTWDEITAEFLEPTTDIFGLFTVKKIDLDNNDVPCGHHLGSVWRLASCMYNGNDASTGIFKVCAASIAMDYGYSQDGEGNYMEATSVGIDFMLYENQLHAEYTSSGNPL